MPIRTGGFDVDAHLLEDVALAIGHVRGFLSWLDGAGARDAGLRAGLTRLDRRLSLLEDRVLAQGRHGADAATVSAAPPADRPHLLETVIIDALRGDSFAFDFDRVAAPVFRSHRPVAAAADTADRTGHFRHAARFSSCGATAERISPPSPKDAGVAQG